MANYIGSARTNYFNVKSLSKFNEALLEVPDIELVFNDDDQVGIIVSDGDSGTFPSFIWDDDKEDDVELDLAGLVSEHLVEGEVAIFMEVGAEKLRYVSGYAEAINSKGERKSISLNNIYDLAAGLTDSPKPITLCEF